MKERWEERGKQRDGEREKDRWEEDKEIRREVERREATVRLGARIAISRDLWMLSQYGLP